MRTVPLALSLVLLLAACPGEKSGPAPAKAKAPAAKTPPPATKEKPMTMKPLPKDADLPTVLQLVTKEIDEIAALAENDHKAAAEQVGLMFQQRVPAMVMGLAKMTDAAEREKLRKEVTKQIARMQRIRAIPREPKSDPATWGKPEIETRIRAILAQPGVGSLATINNGKPWVRFVSIMADKDLNILVGTFKNSRKVEQIGKSPFVHVAYRSADPAEVEYLQIAGKAEISEDPAQKKAAWSPPSWLYFKSPEDPDYVVIKIVPESIELWNLVDLKDGDFKHKTWTP